MTTTLGLLEKKSSTFTENNDFASGALDKTAVLDTKKQEKDNLLEKTLFETHLDEPLTKRESEILGFIVSGETNKKIAQKIHRTERTVEYHRNRLMHKLNAHTAADLVRRAIIMGLA